MLETKQNSFRHIGRPRRRADAPERLTGRTRFTQDLALADALHVHFVRSPYASARIVSLDKQAALAIPGVVAVLTVRDLPLADPEGAVLAREIVMAFDRVVHRGQPGAAGPPGDDQDDSSNPNIASRPRFERGDVNAGFQASDIVVERVYHTNWVSQAYLETQSCTATVDPLGDLTVYASTQALFHTRGLVARVP